MQENWKRRTKQYISKRSKKKEEMARQKYKREKEIEEQISVLEKDICFYFPLHVDLLCFCDFL